MGNRLDSLTLIAHGTDMVAGNASYAINGFRAITGLQGFRSYSWMTDTAATNVVGDFRGMVVSARWASAYNVISPIAKVAGNVATLAALAGNIMDMAPQFKQQQRGQSAADFAPNEHCGAENTRRDHHRRRSSDLPPSDPRLWRGCEDGRRNWGGGKCLFDSGWNRGRTGSVFGKLPDQPRKPAACYSEPCYDPHQLSR